jgi:hypothetical protein
MLLKIAPKAALEPAIPSVGIFWLVDAVLVVDRTPVEEAEPYGDCVTHAGGHFERWESWQTMGGTKLAKLGFPTAVASTEYDEWPRGRVVYETPTRRFVLYSDKRLQKTAIVDALKDAFGLIGSETVIKSDSHYR